MRKFLALVLLLVLMALPQGVLPESGEAADAGVGLIVFVWDPCGGCGMDNPGCGECKDMLMYHDTIKKQLGDRLYDGSLVYRMHNCKLTVNEEKYKEYLELFGREEDGLPAVFIGDAEDGVVLFGVEKLETVAEVLDQYLAGETE